MKTILNLYPDSIGPNLNSVVDFLKKDELKDTFTSVYLLPSVFTTDLDRGFSVQSYDLEPSLATKNDLEEIKRLNLDLALDLVLNHCSVLCPQFQDILFNGKKSEYYDFFIDWDEFWKDVVDKDEKIAKMFFRKPGLPLLEVTCKDSTKIKFWNTFYQEQLKDGSYLGQMDLNVNSPKVWTFYEETLKKLKDYGCSLVRLDAFAYASKIPGMKNMLNEPETWELLQKVDNIAKPLNLRLLPEIHDTYASKTYLKIASRGYYTYDFFLPGLILDAIDKQDGSYLKLWAEELTTSKIKTVNMLGCHDGIPLLDLRGLLPDERIQDVIDTVVSRGGLIKNLHGRKDIYYQVNATYYSALGEDPQRLLLARAIQLFMPGVSQIWYLDLFGGKNNYEKVKEGHKEINRTNLTHKEVNQALQTDLVKEQLKLIKFRNTHPAFGFDSKLSITTNDNKLSFKWEKNNHFAILEADLKTAEFKIVSN